MFPENIFTTLIVNCFNDYKMLCFKELPGRMRINTLFGFERLLQVDV